jgi:diguanylate cyclase (GGDEF)-like protein
LAEELIEHAPERWVSWHSAVIISATMANRVELAQQYYANFMNDPRSEQQLGPLNKFRLAKAYLDIEKGETKSVIQALNAYYVNNANSQLGAFRELSMQYNVFIDKEIEALEKNTRLQAALLNQQTMVNGFGIAIIVGLIVFTVFLMKSHKKQRILATYDSLTSMYNRRGFLKVLTQQLEKSKRDGTMLALGTLDIDGFKTINDAYGHVIGDSVLKTAALRLKETLGQDVVAGRMGGDEFAFMLTKIVSNDDIVKAGTALRDALKIDMQFSNLNLKVNASIGLSSYPESANSVKQLIDCADFALHACKQFDRGGVRLFSPDDQSSLEAQRKLEAALATAKDDEFFLYYQAIVDAQTEEVKGFEALARWQSPELGFVSPADFIPVAERTGLINNLSRLLLGKALAEATNWPEHITLSFNLSSQDVNSLENAEVIKQIVLDSSFPVNRLIAEMTETAIIKDIDTTSQALRLLTDAGVSVALDDFGTGYSSINHLLDFDFERIKLDKKLIDFIEEDQHKVEIVQTLADLCHNLKIDCVVEGVETDSQKVLLQKMKVNKFQGYLFSKPIPPQDIPAYCARHSG